jgi:hypothetical protein
MSSRLSTLRAGLVLALCLLGGCVGVAKQPTPLVRDFFRSPISAQQTEIKNKSPGEQLELVYWAMCCVHPPALYVVRGAAPTGAPLAALALERYPNLDSELDQVTTIELLAEMNAIGSYVTFDKPALLSKLSDDIARMKEPAFRRFATDALRRASQRP